MKTTFMKLKIFTLVGVLALVAAFSLTISRAAKAATDLGYSLETSTGNGELTGEGNVRTVQAYSDNGQNLGSYTYDFSNLRETGIFQVTFESPRGKMVFDVIYNDNLALTEGNQLLFAGEITKFTERTGAYKNVTRMIFRCQFTLDDHETDGIRLPKECDHCIHLFVRDFKD